MYVANWKMNGSLPKIEAWLKGIGKSLDKSLQKECVFCPPSCYLFQAAEIIKNEKLKILLGAQDIDPNYKKPLTGGINASMMKELGCDYVIIGHSERRQVFKEKNTLLIDKLKSASEQGLKIIFCIGESLEQKQANQTFSIIQKQLEIINKVDLKEFIIAYEPIWAIGSGQIAQPSYITDIHNKITNLFKGSSKGTFQGVSYGGSVDSSTSKKILALKDVAGLLIGSASLQYQEFSNIVLSKSSIKD